MSVYLRELAPVTEPADVGEVGCRLLHTGHPGVVNQGEGDAVLAQKRRQIGTEPATVAHLDSVARPLRQGRQEILEHPHTLYGEGRRKLEEQGTEPIFEGLHGVHEAFYFAAGIDEVSLVRNLLGVKYATHKWTHSHGRRSTIAQTPRLLSIAYFMGS